MDSPAQGICPRAEEWGGRGSAAQAPAAAYSPLVGGQGPPTPRSCEPAGRLQGTSITAGGRGAGEPWPGPQPGGPQGTASQQLRPSTGVTVRVLGRDVGREALPVAMGGSLRSGQLVGNLDLHRQGQSSAGEGPPWTEACMRGAGEGKSYCFRERKSWRTGGDSREWSQMPPKKWTGVQGPGPEGLRWGPSSCRRKALRLQEAARGCRTGTAPQGAAGRPRGPLRSPSAAQERVR